MKYLNNIQNNILDPKIYKFIEWTKQQAYFPKVFLMDAHTLGKLQIPAIYMSVYKYMYNDNSQDVFQDAKNKCRNAIKRLIKPRRILTSTIEITYCLLNKHQTHEYHFHSYFLQPITLNLPVIIEQPTVPEIPIV